MKYRFKTEYKIDTTPEQIWDTLADVEAWPGIWKYFRQVRLRGNDKELRTNAVIDCEVRAVLPYTIKFNTEIVRVIPYRELEVISRGDLKGRGLWTLEHNSGSTLSSFTWEVVPDNKYINMISSIPFGSSLLRYSHNFMMESGYRSLLAFLEQNKTSEPA